MPGAGSRRSISAPHRMHWITIPSSFMERDSSSSAFDYDASVIPAIVLAAGRSSRMGRAKALLPLGGGETFLTRIVGTFLDAGVDDVVIVVGHERDEIVQTFAASGLPARFAVNADYDRGQLSSLLAGIAVVDRPGVSAVLMTLVDVPFVSAATVRAVVDHYRRTRAAVVRPTSGARHGHPLLIDRALFGELRAISRSRMKVHILISIRSRSTRGQSAIGRSPARTMLVRRGGPGLFDARKILLFSRPPAHFRFCVPFSDQPRADAQRHVTRRSGPQTVEPHAVELLLARRFFDSNFHRPTFGATRTHITPIRLVDASNSKLGAGHSRASAH